MFDMIIIGAGPVGLFCAFEAGMLNMRVAIIEALGEIGGQCSALYQQKPIYDIPAHPMLLAGQLISNLEQQVAPFKPEIILNTRVESLSKSGEIFTLSSGNLILETKAVVIAAGGGSFLPNKPPLNDIDIFEQLGAILYTADDIDKFKNKNIVIAGGGDSAVDFALLISKVAKKVYVVHRRNKFRALDASVSAMQKLAETDGVIELIIPYQLCAINGEHGKISSISVSNIQNNEKLELEADFLIPLFGLSMDIGPIANWGLKMDKKHIEVDNATMMTSVNGVFAIGDIATYSGKLKLILTGFAEAARACHCAYTIVNSGSELHFEHSTSKGLPK